MQLRLFIFQMLHLSGVTGVLRGHHQRHLRFPILCFHRIHPVYDKLTQPYSPSFLRQLIQSLSTKYQFYPLDVLTDPAFSDSRACFVTFDDAVADFYEYTYPILRSEQVPVTLFVPTESVNTQVELYNYEVARMLLPVDSERAVQVGDHAFRILSGSLMQSYLKLTSLIGSNPERRREWMQRLREQLPPAGDKISPMTWAQLKEVQQGGVTLASHFHTHSWLPAMTAADQLAEVEQSLQLLQQHTGVSCRFMAYPMGGFDQATTAILQEHGLIGLDTSGKLVELKGGSTWSRFNLSDRSVPEILARINGIHSAIQRLKK